MVFNVSPRFSLPLSALMLVFSIGIAFIPNEEMKFSDMPLFTTTRNSSGEFFAARRVEEAFIHYYLLHAIPAAIWSVFMPMQYWDTLRKSRPALHRFTGYVAASCSLVLTITGLAFMPRQLAFSKPLFTMHHVYGVPLFPSFNFATTFIAAPLMLITGSRAIYLARHKRFTEHRRWAVYHGIAGYTITIQRVWMLLFNLFGQVLKKTPELQKFLRTDRILSLQAKSEAELAVFAFTTYAAILTSFTWTLYVRRQNSLTRKIKTL